MNDSIDTAYLILDQGGHANRALLFDEHGQLLAHASNRLETDHRAGVEHDSQAIVAGLRACIDQAMAESGLAPGQIHAAGLACQRASVVCWDRVSGDPLSPVISWQDTRGAERFELIDMESAALRRITGLVPSAHYGAAKLAWCLDNLTGVRHAVRKQRLAFGPLASYLLFQLLNGRPRRVNYSIAQRTLLFDIDTCDWSPRLLEAFGIQRGDLPKCAPDVCDHGHLNIGGRAVPLRVAAGDQNAVPFALGGPDSSAAYLNLGTGGFLLRPLARGETHPEGLLKSILPGPDGVREFAVEGTINGAGAALDWLRRQDDAPTTWHNLDSGDPSADDPLFVNSVGNLGSPWWRTGVEPRFEPAGAAFDARMRSVIESIVFLARVNFERMADTQAPPRRLWLGGGLSQSRLVCQLLADVLGVAVLRPETSVEMTARGVLTLLRGRASGTGPRAREFKPRSTMSARREMRYRRWLELLERA